MLGVGVDMADDVDDAVGVSPFHKIDAHTGILFTAAARENHAEIPGLAVRPGHVVRRGGTNAAADACCDAAYRAVLIPSQGFDRKLFVLFNAGTAVPSDRTEARSCR